MVSGISSGNLLNDSMQSIQGKQREMQQEFQQLGQDLQSGNLSAAQSDFATLTQMVPPAAESGTSAVNSNPIEQAFTQLGQDLQSGNLTAAQKDYATIQQDMQSSAVQGFHHHHHRGAAQGNDQVSQLFQQLGQALQSGDLATAQQAYSSLQQGLQDPGSTYGVAADPIIVATEPGTPSNVSLEA